MVRSLSSASSSTPSAVEAWALLGAGALVPLPGPGWLITGSGERVIGSWQAGDTEAAFAHFGLRFDDLHTEIALMEHRLSSGTGDARKIKTAAAALASREPSMCTPSPRPCAWSATARISSTE